MKDKHLVSILSITTLLSRDYQKLAQIQNSDILQKETLEMEKRQIADETTKMTSEHNDIMNNMKSQYSKLLEEVSLSSLLRLNKFLSESFICPYFIQQYICHCFIDLSNTLKS